MRPAGAHDQIRTNTRGYIKFSYTDQRHEVDAYYFDLNERAGALENSINQSLGVLFEEDNKTRLERIEFVSRWSGKSVEASVSGKSSQFVLALEFPPRELNRLTTQSPVPDQMYVGIGSIAELVKDRAQQQLLSDELPQTKFLILNPKQDAFNYRLFSIDTTSAKERTIPAIVVSRQGEILASTQVTMYLPE